MDNEPHYIIVEGTNLRLAAEGLNAGTINVYDTSGRAQQYINGEIKQRAETDKLLNRPPQSCTHAPISVAEYNRKYRDINKEK